MQLTRLRGLRQDISIDLILQIPQIRMQLTRLRGLRPSTSLIVG